MHKSCYKVHYILLLYAVSMQYQIYLAFFTHHQHIQYIEILLRLSDLKSCKLYYGTFLRMRTFLHWGNFLTNKIRGCMVYHPKKHFSQCQQFRFIILQLTSIYMKRCQNLGRCVSRAQFGMCGETSIYPSHTFYDNTFV